MIRGSWCRPFKRLAGSWVMRQAGNGAQLELIVQFESRIPLATRFMVRRIDRVLNQSLERLDRLVLDVEGSDEQ
jgi:ribosome-associated toxin RatA of RatAB toxin-antitoxin module